MKKRNIFIVFVFIIAVLAILMIMYSREPKTGEENEAITTEVAVHTGKIMRATLHRYVIAYGSVEPESASEGRLPASASVASPVAGIVSQINCAEGQYVARGAILFQLDSRIAEVAVQKAKRILEFAEQNFERQKMLIPAEGTSKKAYQEAEEQLNIARNEFKSAEIQLELLKIEAPLTGSLMKVNVKPGEAVDLNTILAEIIDLDRLVVVANIPSREATLLRLNQRIEITSSTSDISQGSINFISKQIDSKTDTVLIRALIPAKSGMRPGQFLSFRIICEERRDRLAVAEESVITDSSGNSTLWIIQGDKAVPKPVKTGLHESGLVEIEGAGLNQGMTIVSEEAYSLPGETKIRIVQ